MDNRHKTSKNRYNISTKIGSAPNINVALYLTAEHQKAHQIDPTNTTNPHAKLPNNRSNDAIFDKVDVTKKFAEIVSIRYPKVPTNFKYSENKHSNQYRDLEKFNKEYVVEHILCPTITYDKKKTY